MPLRKPDRINLSIGSRCWVSCAGCYNFFGDHQAPLTSFAESIRRFIELGIVDVTVSGGDPLLVAGICRFLDRLKSSGVRSLKLDTVGTSLLPYHGARHGVSLEELACRADVLSLPLDGWSEETVAIFRRGRPRLLQETCALLTALDTYPSRPRIYINTVAHRRNVGGLYKILQILQRHSCVHHWNVFQYTPTDQATHGANVDLRLDDEHFALATRAMTRNLDGRRQFEIEFASRTDRLGKYLLINSVGDVWLPDASGRTISLGRVFDREDVILEEWARLVTQLQPDCVSSELTAAHTGAR